MISSNVIPLYKMRYSIEPRDSIDPASKRAIHKTAEATGDLISHKIADEITSVLTELHSKKAPTELHSKEL